MRKDRGFTLIELMIVIAIIAIIAAIAVPSLMQSQKAANEKSAVGSLKTLRDMNAKFRQEDPDRNALSDFWTIDVSGLHRVLNGAGTEIQMVGVAVARSDASPTAVVALYIGTSLGTSSAKAGYFLRSMTNDGTTAYNVNAMGDGATIALNTNRFAFCAYPEVYGETGTNIFIVNQVGDLWRRDTGNNSAILTWVGANPGSLTPPWGSID